MAQAMYVEYIAVLLLLSAVVCIKSAKKYYIPAKICASASFLAALFLAPDSDTALDIAFVCCFVGDVLMGMYNMKRKRRFFMGGLFVFLTAHICFVIWLCMMDAFKPAQLICPGIIAAAIFYITNGHGIHTGRLRPFIVLYAFVMSLFLTKAVCILNIGISERTILIALGGILFAASDFSILFLYFAKTKGKGIHIFNLLTYYGAMFVLALSMYELL